jgi:ADP-heptose:LPS heptosyltransferase
MSGRRPSHPGISPLRGRYLVRNPAWNAWLRANDAIAAFLRPRQTQDDTRAVMPRRVLVCVSGHLGDAVIATSLLSQLRHAAPGAELGVLTGSWNRNVFDGHPLVRWVHTIDHWKLSRAPGTFVTRWMEARRTRRLALGAVGDIGYDAAIDLSPYYPNFARALAAANIPTRVGFTSGGDGPFYTHPVEWTSGRHVTDDHALLLERLLPGFDRGRGSRYELGDHSPAASERAERLVRSSGFSLHDFVVLHPGSGVERKEWPVGKWVDIARTLATRKVAVVLTGSGPRQSMLCRHIELEGGCHANLCDRLSWDEFRWIVAHAALVLTVDTVTMHLASAEGVPCVSVMSAMDDPIRWKPPGDHTTLLTHRVPCAPCFRSKGCSDMSCVREIAVETMMEAATLRLRAGASP